MDVETLCRRLEATMHKEMPISHFMGVGVLAFDRSSLVIAADLEPNINIHGTAFAGSLYSICTLAGWGLVTLAVDSHQLAASVVVASAEVRYMKPVQSPKIVAQASFQGALSDALAKYENTGKARIAVQATIEAGDAQAVAFTGQYVLLAE